MSVLYIVVPLALLVVAGAVVLFLWATRSGQFDDLQTPPRRILLDDEPAERQAPRGWTAGSSSARARGEPAPPEQRDEGGE